MFLDCWTEVIEIINKSDLRTVCPHKTVLELMTVFIIG